MQDKVKKSSSQEQQAAEEWAAVAALRLVNLDMVVLHRGQVERSLAAAYSAGYAAGAAAEGARP